MERECMGDVEVPRKKPQDIYYIIREGRRRGWRNGGEKGEKSVWSRGGEEKNERFSHYWAPIGWGGRIYVLERLRFPATWMLSAMVNWMLWSMREYIQFQQFFFPREKDEKWKMKRKWEKKWKKEREGEKPAKKRQKRPGSNTNLESGTMVKKNITTIYKIYKWYSGFWFSVQCAKYGNGKNLN